MKILGIDPGIKNLGLAIIEDGCLVRTRVVTSPSKELTHETITYIYDEVTKEIVNAEPDFAAIEGYAITSRFFREAMAEVGSAARLSFAHKGIPYLVIPPTACKYIITGKGNADKKQMMATVNSLIASNTKPFDTDFKLMNHNVCDAIAMALVAKLKIDGADVYTDKKTVELLNKLEWRNVRK